MRKWVCLVLAALLLAGSCAIAEQKVQLPDSRFYLMLPDEMEYDGPGPQDGAKFAYVAEKLGLDISFFSYDGKGAELSEMVQELVADGADAALYRIAGQEMIVYRTEDPEDHAKCIGYVLKDGENLVEIVFFYATQKAADMTEEIMLSLTE